MTSVHNLMLSKINIFFSRIAYNSNIQFMRTQQRDIHLYHLKIILNISVDEFSNNNIIIQYHIEASIGQR